MTKKYLVRTFGCQMNEHDSERIAGMLDDDGYEETSSADDADVIVFNTCCIRENADEKLYGQLSRLHDLKKSNSDLKIVVAGCLAQKDKELVRQKAPHVDVVFGTHNLGRAVELINQSAVSGPITEIWEESDTFPSALPVRRDTSFAAWVTIQIGCDNNCAFCIVPSVRGSEISRPFGEVLSEVRELAERGVVEVTLLGQNVNSYGRDLTLAQRNSTDPTSEFLVGSRWLMEKPRIRPLFSDLLRAVAEVPGIERVRYTSPHPKDMREETFIAMAETPEVCEHLHFPLQSGSDRVLSLMHRGYAAERYLEKLAQARQIIPDVAVTSDIIVGFPGETDDDFERTLEVAAAAEYDSVFTFIYSPRTGTEAAAWSDQFLDPEVVNERYERLDQVVQRSSLIKHGERAGLIEELIVEGPNKKDPSQLTGRTRQNKVVHFETPQMFREGTRLNVRITYGAPHHLLGEFVELVAAPRHKVRIPVAAAG